MKKSPYALLPALLAVFGLLFLYIALQIGSERLSYRIGELKKDLEKERNTNTQLHITLSRLASPERLDKIAKELKYSSPGQSQIVELTVKNEVNK